MGNHEGNRDQDPAKQGWSGSPDVGSYSQRILDSASGLLRDAIHPGVGQASSALLSALASESKAGPSTGMSSAALPTIREQVGSLNGKQALRSLADQKHALRVPLQPSGNINARSMGATEGLSLDELMHSENCESVLPTSQYGSSAKGKQRAPNRDALNGKNQHADIDWTSHWNSLAPERTKASAANSHLEGFKPHRIDRAADFIEEDGADVVKLLQDPNCSRLTDISEQMEIPFTISEEDMRIAEDIIRRIDMVTTRKASSESAAPRAKHSRPRPDISSLFDDIENYQDEVWGYLQPLIEDAKQERAQADAFRSVEGPATRRLKMILHHIGESTGPV